MDGIPGRNAIKDITVTTTLAGDFDATHLYGDNSGLLPTDSHKNAAYAFAKNGIGEIEDFGLRLARYFVDSINTVKRACIHLQEHHWDRVNSHAFVRSGRETRTATITYDGTTRVGRLRHPRGSTCPTCTTCTSISPPFGMDNHEEVLYPSDRPYGLMEGTVLRDDAPDPGLAWW